MPPRATTSSSIFLLYIFIALASAQANVFFNYGGIGDRTFHSFNETSQENLYMSLSSYLCTASSCASGSCSHLYCATDSSGRCTSGDMNWSISLGNVALTYACCTGTNVATDCGQPANAGGFVSLVPQKIGLGTSVSYTGRNKQCQAVYTNSWDWVAPIDVATIQSFCTKRISSSGKPYIGWTPVFAPGPVGNVPGGNGFVTVNVINSNNNVDPIFFNASLALSSSMPSVGPATVGYLNGPSAGTFQSPNCGAQAQVPAPQVCGSYSGCSASCGCAYMTMLNRTYNANGCGQNCPTTTFLFQMCLLCDYGFSYLALCGQQQGQTVLYGLDGNSNLDGTYTGIQGCTYTIGTGGQTTVEGCSVIKYAKGSGSCSWGMGECDLFPITLAGNVDDYTFTFSVHAGQGSTVQVINLKSDACLSGSCPDGTTFNVANVGSCSCPTTTNAPTPSQTPNAACPNGLCGSDCNSCCYTSMDSYLQGYCVPLGNDQWSLTLLPKDVAPPIGAIRPNQTTSNGCQLDCNCKVEYTACNCGLAENCLCNTCTGVCETNEICYIPKNTPAVGSTCAPCPLGISGVECNGKGVCNCGQCLCANTSNAGGAACDEPTNGGQYTSCLDCALNGYTWCNLAGIDVCMVSLDCTTLGGAIMECNNLPIGCDNNCTCPGNIVRGICVTQDGLSQCNCKKGWHGSDCCSAGGLSRGAIAGIAAGAIAGIVVAGLVAFIVLGYAAKKGVDWIAIRNQNMAAAHDNPTFKPQTTEHTNPLSV